MKNVVRKEVLEGHRKESRFVKEAIPPHTHTEFLCVALEPVPDLALIDQVVLELKDPPTSAS